MNKKILFNHHIGNIDAAFGGNLCLGYAPAQETGLKNQNNMIMQSSFAVKPTARKRSVQVILKCFALFILATSITVNANKAFAQDALQVSKLTMDKNSTAWHLLKSVDGVQISYQYVACGPVEYLQYKIENTTKNKLTVSWTYHKPVAVKNLAVNNNDVSMSQVIDAGATLAGDCSYKNDNLRVFVREGGRNFALTDIELINIKTTITQ